MKENYITNQAENRMRSNIEKVVYKAQKEQAERKAKMSTESGRQEVQDFIFGK